MIFNVSNDTFLVPDEPRTRSMPETVASYMMWVTNTLAIFGNLLLIVVFAHRKKLKVHDILITTLAILDLTHSFFNALQNSMPLSWMQVIPKSVYCFSNHFFYHFIMLSSCFTVIEITIDRLLAVRSVLFHRVHVTNKRCLLVVGGTQIGVILLLLPASGVCIDG